MQIAVALKSVGAGSVGIPRLSLNLHAKNASQFNLGIVRLTAEVYVAPAMYEHEMNKCPFVGYGEQEYQSVQLSMGQEQDWKVNVLLHPYALSLMEEVRNKGDLFLVVLFYCAGANMKDNASPLTNLDRVSVYAEAHSGEYNYFSVPQSEWEKTLKNLRPAGFSEFEEAVRKASERAQEQLREIEGISAKAREAASIVGVAQHAIHFKDEAESNRRAGWYWLGATVVLAFFGALYSLWSFRQGLNIPLQGAAALWPHLAYITSRVLVLSVVFFGMGWSAKIYRAHKHNETVNRHRQNALRTFETFAVATEDKATKDAVLLQTTKSIFEPQSSGYLAGEPEKVPSGAIIEVLRNVMSSRESS